MSRADLDAVNPATGEVLEHLDRQPPEALAEALHEINIRKAELKHWGDALEQEVRQRLKLRQTRFAVFGEWEVELATSRESQWDPDELERAMRQLIDDGTIRVGDVADIITRQPVVARGKARDLARRLDGDARAQIEACCTWREKAGRLTVARSVNLLDVAPGAAEETPPLSGHADRDGAATDAGPAAAGSSEPPEAATRQAPPPPPDTAAAPARPSILDPEELFR